MAQGDTSEDTAAGRLHQLDQYYREHPVTGADGHSYISNQPRPSATHPGLPFNVRVLEHIDRTVTEVVDHTREINPEATPPPENVLDVYRWCAENTAHAPEVEQQRRETLEYRHWLEHAVAAGDTKVIRPHRCPDCMTFGLMWDNLTRQVRCTNRDCVDEQGLGTVVSFSRLAHERIAGKNNLRQVSTT